MTDTKITVTDDMIDALKDGKQNILNMAGHLSLEFGAVVTGPYAMSSPVPGYLVRVIMPNRYGVVLTAGGPRMIDTMDAVGVLTVREDGEELRTHDFPGAMGERRYDVTLEEVRQFMRGLPLN